MLQVILLVLAVAVGLAVVMTMDVEPRSKVDEPPQSANTDPATEVTEAIEVVTTETPAPRAAAA